MEGHAAARDVLQLFGRANMHREVRREEGVSVKISLVLGGAEVRREGVRRAVRGGGEEAMKVRWCTVCEQSVCPPSCLDVTVEALSNVAHQAR